MITRAFRADALAERGALEQDLSKDLRRGRLLQYRLGLLEGSQLAGFGFTVHILHAHGSPECDDWETEAAEGEGGGLLELQRQCRDMQGMLDAFVVPLEAGPAPQQRYHPCSFLGQVSIRRVMFLC